MEYVTRYTLGIFAASALVAVGIGGGYYYVAHDRVGADMVTATSLTASQAAIVSTTSTPSATLTVVTPTTSATPTATLTVEATQAGAKATSTPSATATTSATTVPSPTPSPTTPNKAYTNTKYGYSFTYATGLQVLPNLPTSDQIILLGKDDYGYFTASAMSANGQSVEDLLAKQITSKLATGSTHATMADVTETDVVIGGLAGKSYTINKYGLYGNAGAVVVLPNGNALILSGDISSKTNAAHWVLFENSFSVN